MSNPLELGPVEANYLKQLNLEHPWRIFFWSTEIEFLDWQGLRDSLNQEGSTDVSTFIRLDELEKEFTYLKCPPGYIVVGATNPKVEKPVYGFVKVT